MIIIYHQNNKIIETDFEGKTVIFSKKSIASNLFDIAGKYPEELIILCHQDLKSNLNTNKVQEIFHHKRIVASYNLSADSFLPEAIGYVDSSLFLNVKKEVSYPTWMMSTHVVGIHAEVLNALKKHVFEDSDFGYFLNSVLKLAMPLGLYCYSEPKLLIKRPDLIFPKFKKNNFLLFRFVKQHYKTRWIFLLFLNLFIYERKFALFPLFFTLFYNKRHLKDNVLEQIEIKSKKKVVKEGTIDVIIPTIGRKKYLHDFLTDLALQTYLPNTVVIVEQNPLKDSVSELDFIKSNNWPFRIKHIFTHQTGACNARNLALAEISSEWVFMADDDIRINKAFLEEGFEVIKKEGIEQATFGCYAPDYDESKKIKRRFQSGNFGSGCSIVKSKNIESLYYNTSFEFGYGEDSDYGMQIRNLGFDVIHSPQPEIIHLKAPIGGFREKHIMPWTNDLIQPKPSPTVMLYNLLNVTRTQLKGYKTTLFFKYYRVQKIKNPVKYYNNYKVQWDRSLYWANKLNRKE
ncbi:glycosyltransferase family 2 protein [Flavobacterium crocinum]|uniref:Glycosyltransferase family 2 protein n=1 Tax=Flavobacterium crocinum TaxID=2183896 RepID=A0A2S1YG06_9FLAO|nr:glycosyltransferase [Flavobacterium crocinum]AWK02973.1 glycosyltransferase family 2 protein [Flavobacterium crocinum]